VPNLSQTLNLPARRFAAAIRRFTCIRPAATLSADSEAGEDRRSALRHLPGVGWIVGMAACLVFALVSVLLRGNPWGPAVAAVASTIATVLLTGALHERALYLAAERLGPGVGVLALGLLLAGKLALLAALASASEAGLMAALFAAHAVSRFAPLTMAHWLGSGDEVDPVTVRIGGLWCVAPLLLMVPAAGGAFLLVAILTCAVAGYALLRFCKRRDYAYGDQVLGTAQQVCETAFYLGAALAVA
jgi:adenosylcobinamide-GDP ribazoletransferase